MGQIDFYQQVDGQPDVLGVVKACRQKYKILWDTKINELFIGSLNGIQLSNTVTENTSALLRAILTGTDFMETDVGQHGCNIWTSRCHAISSTIYASAMTSNGVFIFVHSHMHITLQSLHIMRMREDIHIFQQFRQDIQHVDISYTLKLNWRITTILLYYGYVYINQREIFTEVRFSRKCKTNTK